uniref:Uncharacterized protein n=1 Tax=Octactis speculum TaxID=3111310 RepID=A0A7S2FP80_9STRA|mmetsp:Transcript_25687/g.35338  ORF Transcript_25687/g.35338 Transcript_25687/m.35338 type:complete len:101 (+) Transcript_25687:35-337(+)
MADNLLEIPEDERSKEPEDVTTDPEERVSFGMAAFGIIFVILIFIMHEHHHHVHNKRHKVERDLEYILGSLAVFAPILALAIWGYYRNKHFDKIAEYKSM